MPYKDPERLKAYRERNRERLKAYRKAYTEKNREALRAYANAYNEAHREKVKAQLRARYANNRAKVCASQKAYREKNRERVKACQRNSDLRHRFGIDLEAFNLMVEMQGGKCAICHEPFQTGKGTHVDHDHATGKVRGLLCSKHNMGIGYFQDSPALLRAAAGYLERHGK